MKRPRLVAIALAILACSEAPDATAPFAPPPPIEHRLSGTVRDEAGRPLPGASVDIVRNSVTLRSGTTDDAGRFTLVSPQGTVLLRVWKDWYTSRATTLSVFSDLIDDAQLTRLPYSDTIAYGNTVRSYVNGLLPPCDPYHWDARAPCRVFRIAVPSGGLLAIKVSWDDGDPLDVVIASARGVYIATSEDTGLGSAIVQAYLEPGAQYDIRVSSYYSEQVFDLWSHLTPAAGYRRR